MDILIHTDFIKLDQLLKLSGVAPTGGAAKEMIVAGLVAVDGERCIQRGRKIYPGMRVTVEGERTADILVGKEG